MYATLIYGDNSVNIFCLEVVKLYSSPRNGKKIQKMEKIIYNPFTS